MDLKKGDGRMNGWMDGWMESLMKKQTSYSEHIAPSAYE
jgi:hypothetical protein